MDESAYSTRASKTLIGWVALFISFIALILVRPALAEPKRIYLGNDDHTDYFWSGDDVQYRAAFLSMLDFYMAQAEATANKPPDSRGRFNCDGSLWVWEYQHNKTPAEFQRLMGHVRAGDITLPLNNAVLCYGGMPAEAVLRSMYYAGRLERSENLHLPLVLAMENQTLPGGIASLWAGSGAQYSWRGICGCATRTDYSNRPRDVYHFVGPDGQSVCMKWNTKPVGANNVLGTYVETRDPASTVQFLDTNPGYLARWPWSASAAFGYGGDNVETKTDALIVASEQLSNANRRVIVSNEVDFFEDLLAHHGDQIPKFSGSFGNEWDLYSASMGAVTSRFKAEIERLRTAEALASVAALLDPSFLTGREAARDKAFMAAGLYYEHDWTADGVIPRSRRAQFQRDMLRDLETYVEKLYADALAAVASKVALPGSTERHLVFNPLSWSRADFADLVVTTPAPFRVVDAATGAEVPSQILPGGPGTRVRILASNVPSVGYRVYEVRAGQGVSFPPSATIQLPKIDNGLYAVTLGTRGNITSLIDHRNGERQLVDAAGSLNDLGSGSGTVTVESSGPVSTTLLVSAGGTPAHQTRVTLYAGLDRVDVEGRITQNFSNNVSYVSRFALPGATTRHEEVGMIAKVARAAQGGDYADQNARTDYLTFNHFVDLSLADRGVTVSNWDSPFFRAGASTPTFLDATTPSIEAVVGMQVDGTSFGILAQGGDTQFLNRFALRGHGAYDPAAAMRVALEHQNPLVGARVTGTAASPLPRESWSLLTLPSPDVLLWSLKPSEEGIAQGLIARVWNLADQSRVSTLALPGVGIAEARRASHIETDLGPVALAAGNVPLDLERQRMATFRLQPLFGIGNRARILSPVDGSTFASGETLQLRLARDNPDPSGLQVRWEVDLRDGEGVHPNEVVVADTAGSFVAQARGASVLTRYDIRLITLGGAPDTSTVSVFADVDLVPSAIATNPDPIDDQSPAQWSFVVANRGRMPSASFRWQVVAGGTPLAAGDTAVAGLDSITVGFQLPAILSGGAWTVRAVVDTLGQVRETNESNNASLRTLVVSDSRPPSFVSAPTAAAGSDTARVAWETDQLATGIVRYGRTTAFGDSVAASASLTRQSVRLTGLTPGTRYFYYVAVRDAAGNPASSATDSFTTNQNLPPIARAAATPTGGLAPLTVAFSSAGSSDPEGGAIGFLWNFGDGTTSTLANPSHVYAAGGFNAVLTVTDPAGASGSATVTIVASAPSTFPSTAVLDDFNRPDGSMGSSWIDQVTGMSIRSQQLAQTTANIWSVPVWGGATFGPDQEAYVTLSAITATAPEHDILLKVQGNSHLGGHIEVKYDGTVKKIYISTYAPSGGWATIGSVTVTLVAGDRLGARAFANGTVEVYRNTTKLLTGSVGNWPYKTLGGRIGITVAKATSSRLDDFGGGNLGADLTPPSFTVAPTATPARDSAVVRWTASEPARGAVRYGTSDALGDSMVVTSATSASITLAGLARATAYSYRVAITDLSGNTLLSPLATFTTLPNRPPVAAVAGSPLLGPAPLTVSFTAAGSSDPDSDALVQRWSFGDGTNATGPTASHRYARAGTYGVTLSLDDGHGATTSAPLTVVALNTPPHATLATPAAESFFALGDTVALSGTGTDAQDDTLGVRWEVDLADGAGVATNVFAASGTATAFVATGRGDPVSLEYRVRLIVTDRGGLADTAKATLRADVDLSVTRLVATPTAPRERESLALAFTLANAGRMPAGPTRWRVTADGLTVGEGDAAVGARDSVVVTLTMDAGLLAGARALAARVDALDRVFERDEQNNDLALTIRVLSPPDLTPPVFATAPAATPARGTATIRWTTSEPATGALRFAAAGNPWQSIATPLGTTHAAVLTALTHGTAYSYEVAITDTAGNDTTAAPASFTTLSNRAPVAVVHPTSVTGLAPLAVTFLSAGSTDADGDALVASWSFGDGGASTAPTLSHTYAAGSFVAILQIADAYGGVDTASVPIVAIAAPLPFPATSVLDNFDRSKLGTNWVDQISSVSISSNHLAPTTSSTRSIVWTPTVFGADQEAFVKLTSLSSSATDYDLMLKVQGTSWSTGHIQVRYDHKNGRVSVSTFTSSGGWQSAGSTYSVKFSSGDVLGARAFANGTVEVYRKGVKLKSWSVTSWPNFAGTGRIGLTMVGSSSSRFDDFGGGTIGGGPVAVVASAVEMEGEAPDPVATSAAPRVVRLSEGFPNPSRGSVDFRLELPEATKAEFVVYDLRGRVVWSERREWGAGRWTLSWSGQQAGSRAAPGIYFARLRAGGWSWTRRITLVD